VGLVVVLVGWSRTPYKSERGIRREYDCGVIDCAEVGKLHSFEVVIGLEVEGVASKMGLPLS